MRNGASVIRKCMIATKPIDKSIDIESKFWEYKRPVLHICDRNKTELPVNSDFLGTKCVGAKLKKCI